MDVLKRILSYTKVYWKVLTLSGLSAVLYGLTSAAPTYVVQHIIDRVFVERQVSLLIPFIVGFISLFFLKGIFMFFSNYYMNWVGTQVVNDIRGDLLKRIIRFPVSFFQRKTSGELLSYFLNDIAAIQTASSTSIRNGIRSFFEAIFLIGIACTQNIKLAVILFILGPIIGLTIRNMGIRMRATAKKSQQEIGNLSSLLQELVVGIREIKCFNSEDTEISRFGIYLNRYFKSTMSNVRVVSLTPAFIEIIAMGGCGIILYIASIQVLNGSITPGQLASFFSAVVLAYQPLRRMINVHSDVQTGLASASRVFEIMDLKYEETQNRNIHLNNFSSLIEFKNFSFSYNDSTPILENTNISINKGETVGIIGPSGSGKSTICDLLLGFIQGSDETLFIDGKDINKISLASLRDKIGYVGQKTFLFNDTIRSNIKYSKPDATEDQIISACKDAYAHNFIKDLPNGYDTLVGENGTLLSGGQKQRLTIARALLKNPEILIFDEATSALDNQSEQEIKLALKQIAKHKTVILISHRTTLIEKVDKILTVKNKQLISTEKQSYENEIYQGGTTA